MSSPKPPDRKKKTRSIAWLADIYFHEGRQAASTALGLVSPGEMLQNCRVVRGGEQAVRTHAERRDRIDYESFNPPLWAWPYSILRARFDPIEKHKFMYHGGEEILLPTRGSVSYHFFWSPGKSQPTRKLLPNPVMPGSIIRIDPQIPHHTWAAGDEEAEAWMIIRDATDSAAGTHLDLPRDVKVEAQPPRRQLTSDELRQGERYALAAWGISEKIRSGRLRAGLSIRQLAGVCQIDAAQLSRIETGSAPSNVSLDVLIRIARCLGLEIRDLTSAGFTAENDPFKIETIGPAQKAEALRSVVCPPERHFMHLDYWNTPEGKTVDLEDGSADPDAHHSWIVLKGEAIFDLTDPDSGTTRELVDRDSVIHCRNHAGPRSIRALQDLRLLRATHSRRCTDSR
jgi:transcriptional regulator with XRE-family HTH domain